MTQTITKRNWSFIESALDAAVSHEVGRRNANARFRVAVSRKIAEGEIHIGKPELKPGETLSLIDGGTRYAITDGAK